MKDKKKSSFLETEKIASDYLEKKIWEVRENANIQYSWSGLLLHVAGKVIANYTLDKVYTPEIARAHRSGDFHLHNLYMGIIGYCAGWDLQKLLLEGFNLPGKVSSKPARHLDAALLQVANFVGTIQNEWSISADEPLLVANDGKWAVKEISKLPPKVDVFAFDAKGKIKPVKGYVFKHGTSLLLEVTLWLGHRIKITPAHSLFTLNKHGIAPIKGKELKVGDKILIPKRLPFINKSYVYDLKKTSSEKVYGKEFIHLERGKHSIPRYIPLNKELATLFGFYAAEGTTRKNKVGADISFCISRKETQLKKEIVTACKALKLPVRVYKPNFRPSETYIFIGSKILKDLFISKGGHLKKHVPPEIFVANSNIVGAFLKACFSGDGSVKIEKRGCLRVQYKSASKPLLSGLAYLLRMFGIISKLSERTLWISSKPDVKKFYEDIGFYHKSRMAAIKRYLEKNGPTAKARVLDDIPGTDLVLTKVRRIRKLPAEEVYDISVPGMENFIGGTNPLCLHNSGAQAFNSIDTYLAPFVRRDKLTYKKIKQAIQKFVFNMNVTSRWGSQSPFTNITLDWCIPKDVAQQPVVFGGKTLNETYASYQSEVDSINRAFLEVMQEGDMSGRPFTFPIPTYNLTKDFDWGSNNARLLFEMTSKYGLPYFSNFVNSDLNPEDIRSMCCHLRLDLRKLQRNITGGLFGSANSTGSIGVVTINMPRLGYLAKNEGDFFSRLDKSMDLTAQSLEIKRRVVDKNMKSGLLPYTKRYLGTLENHFSTIGLVGMNEACLNFLGQDIASQEGKVFAIKTLKFMLKKLQAIQQRTGNLYNLEATPAESTSYRLALKDKKIWPRIKSAGKATPYYTNSTWLPVNKKIDLFSALKHQEALQTLYTGGTVFHTYLGEQPDPESCKALVKKMVYKTKLPYITITPTYSICPSHGYLVGEHAKCPKCGKRTEVYSRVVGYFRPVQNWNVGKREEFKQRKMYKV